MTCDIISIAPNDNQPNRQTHLNIPEVVPSPRLTIDPCGCPFGVPQYLLGVPLDMTHDVWVHKMVEYPRPKRTRPCVKRVGFILEGDLEFMMRKLEIVYRG